MTDAYRAAATTALVETDAPALSWRSIIAGAVTAASLTLVLLAFGSAVGFSSVSPWSNAGVSTTTFHVASGLYLVVVAMLSSTVGGYMAGRLRHRWHGLYTYELNFRDTAHGFLAWALATVIGAAALGAAATFFVGGTAGGAAAGSSVQASAGTSAPADYYADMLFRPASDRGAARLERNADFADNREARTIFTHDLAAGGTFPAADRAYLAQAVSARTGLNQADAAKRVENTIGEAKAALDKARKAAAALSIWLAISMLVGALAASFAALEGGQLRDRRWKGVFGTRAYEEARIDA